MGVMYRPHVIQKASNASSSVNIVWKRSWPTWSCLKKIIRWRRNWYSHNQSASFRFSGLKFILLVEWLQIVQENTAPVHWYVPSSTAVPVFPRSSSSRIDSCPFQVQMKSFALFGRSQKKRRQTEKTKNTRLSESNIETRKSWKHDMCDSVCTSVVPRACDGFIIKSFHKNGRNPKKFYWRLCESFSM